MIRNLAVGCLFCLTLAVGRTTVAQMEYPLGLAVTESSAFFVADRNLPGVWRADGTDLSLFFKGSKRFRTPLNAVRCLAIDSSGNLLAGDSATREVYRFDENGKPVPLTDGGIGIPMGIAVDSKGQILVSDLELHRIWRVPKEGGKPELVAEVPAPRGLCIDSEDHLWVVSHGKNQLIRIAPDGTIKTVVEGRPFQFPHTVVLGTDNTAYVCDGYAKAVWTVASGGKPKKWASGDPLINPVGLAWQGESLLVVDPHAKPVFQVDPTGKLAPLTLKVAE